MAAVGRKAILHEPGPARGMGAPQQSPGSYQPGGAEQANASPINTHAPVTAKTQGIVGISNYKFSVPGDVTQGSVVSSEPSNVKLEGVVVLLRGMQVTHSCRQVPEVTAISAISTL